MTKPTDVYYGAIDDMVAEVSALVMPAEWLAEHSFTHCIMLYGDEQYDTEFFTNLADARAEAQHCAEWYGIPYHRV